jgi:hypothetical protein
MKLPRVTTLLLVLALPGLAYPGEAALQAFWVLPGKERATREVDPKAVIKSCRVISQNNHNTHYWISVKPTPSPAREFHGLVLQGDGFRLTSQGHGASGETLDSISFYADAATAARVAKALNARLEDRKHPGYQLATRFVWGDMNKTNIVTLEITNVGDVTVCFMDGGRNRGRRNNQFGFAAFRDMKPLPDIGDPVHFGGLAGYVTLKKRETFRKTVDLTKWFDLSEGGHYSFVGTFYLEFHPPDHSHPILWSDIVAAEFAFHKRKPAVE